jgi:uncharacterized protein
MKRLIASGFRPSDDACTFPFLIPSNLFAVTALGYLAQMANSILHDSSLANEAAALPAEVASALKQHGIAQTAQCSIWAYEVDGYGSQLLMDDANVPNLLGLPYLASSPTRRSMPGRAALSGANTTHGSSTARLVRA